MDALNQHDTDKKRRPGSLLGLLRVGHVAEEVAGLAAAQAADRVDSRGRDGLAGADLDDRAVADLVFPLQTSGRPSTC